VGEKGRLRRLRRLRRWTAPRYARRGCFGLHSVNSRSDTALVSEIGVTPASGCVSASWILKQIRTCRFWRIRPSRCDETRSRTPRGSGRRPSSGVATVGASRWTPGNFSRSGRSPAGRERLGRG